MTIFSYQNLEVYKKAFAANQKVYCLLKGNKGIPRYANDQIGRASLCIMWENKILIEEPKLPLTNIGIPLWLDEFVLKFHLLMGDLNPFYHGEEW